jgi:CheY-like chemotaxis protein
LEIAEKPKILVVEDDLENQKFLRILLRKNFNVEISDNAEESHSLLTSKHFDIILMDISLRGKKDGLEFTRDLKSDPLLKNIPIVGLSAHAFARDKDNAYKAGVDLFFTKPVDASYLLENLIKLYNTSKENISNK